MPLFLRRLILLAVLVSASVVGGFAWILFWAEQPRLLSGPKIMVLARGVSTRVLGQQLADAGLISNPIAFAVLARLTRSAGDLKAGEYEFPARATPDVVLALLRSGKTVVHRLVIPEGTTSFMAVALIESAEALQGHVGDIPAEGKLLPETYFYSLGYSRPALLARMEAGMTHEVSELWAQRAPDLPLVTPDDAVTLASIVEKETAIESERGKIAAVFYNRLKMGMKLQSDPTVIYAVTLGKGLLNRALIHADLEISSPYNTYIIKGLPPAPIGNPGRAALKAVLHPDISDALYFVANGSGGHAFAASLAAHNQNVSRWRQIDQRLVPATAAP